VLQASRLHGACERGGASRRSPVASPGLLPEDRMLARDAGGSLSLKGPTLAAGDRRLAPHRSQKPANHTIQPHTEMQA